MRKIEIRNLGALGRVNMTLDRINVIIGPQSLGKSTVLKVASYCSWVEKRIELTQDHEQFAQEGVFISELVSFHKLSGYVKPDTFIRYESDHMKFAYNNKTGAFDFEWKEGHWDYCRPKVSYIPSERNLVAAIPNWYEVSMGRNNIRDFMTDWETARQTVDEDLEILDLDVSYHFESSGKKDKVLSRHASPLDFTNTSSGLQSLIPLFVHLNYLYTTQYKVEKDKKIAGDWENDNILKIIYRELFHKTGRTKKITRKFEDGQGGHIEIPINHFATIGNIVFRF